MPFGRIVVLILCRRSVCKSIQESPPGYESTHRVPSGVMASLATNSPGRPSFTFHVRHLCCEGSHIARPAFVPTQSLFRLSRTVAQTTESGNPSDCDQPIHSFGPGQRSIPLPPKPSQIPPP